MVAAVISMGWARQGALPGRIGRAALAASALVAAAGLLLAPAAASAAAAPASSGSFTSWQAAQKAAGFALISPHRLFRMRRASPIQVSKCMLTNKVTRNTVIASYAGSRQRSVLIQEVGYHLPCGDLGQVKVLGHYQVHGARATLYGSCGMPGAPSCHNRKISLDLLWVSHHKSYGIACFAVSRAQVLGFARGMRRVR